MGQLLGLAALRGHQPQIAQRGKGDRPAIGRQRGMVDPQHAARREVKSRLARMYSGFVASRRAEKGTVVTAVPLRRRIRPSEM
jgi:hypothetical protein